MNSMMRAAVAAAFLAAAATPASAAPLDRAKIVLPSAIALDLTANTTTLPLYRGTAHGATVWYIKTDVSDAAVAKAQGLLYSPALSAVGEGAQTATGDSSSFAFSGTVDFTPERSITTDGSGSVTAAKPGSVGDAEYSPFVRNNGVVYNAPIVAAGEHPSDVTHHTDTLDRVVAIDTSNPVHAQVTLVLARGFTNGQPIAYISTDASVDAPAAIERSTYAPRLAKVAGGAVPIDVFFNGRDDAQGQGIPFTALKGRLGVDATPSNAAQLGSPLNIQSTFPAAGNGPSGYSPLWNVSPAVWTDAALKSGKAHRVQSLSGVSEAAAAGLVTGPGGKAFGPAGIFVNCPVVGFAQTRPQ